MVNSSPSFTFSDDDRAVLRRLKDALPTAGINGWTKGVEVLERLLRDSLAAKPSPADQGNVLPAQSEWMLTDDARIAGVIADNIEQGKLDHAGFYRNTQLAEVLRRVLSAALAARQPVGQSSGISGEVGVNPAAWMTHHDEPMLFLLHDEAAAYCDDDEKPVPLYTTLPAQPSGNDGELEEHSDSIAVDTFANAMKSKMHVSRLLGRSGWSDRSQCSQEKLSQMLHAHVAKGDPVDVANFCMMLSLRGEVILPRAIQVPDNEIVRQILGRPNFACIELAGMLRMLGVEIPRRAGSEQAAVLLFLLNCYLELPDRWHDNVRDKLRRIDEAYQAKASGVKA